MPPYALSLLCIALPITLLGCPGALNPTLPQVQDMDDVATCRVAKDPNNPLIVEWPGTNKVALESTSKRGYVIVSYVGCVLKVLQDCRAEGSYGFTGVTPARDTLMMASESDLYARLPLGAASLRGELATGTALELDYIAVGERRAERGPTELEGDCEGATHYVASMMLGAYALDSVASGSIGGGVEVQGAGFGGNRREHLRRLRGSGELTKCEGQAPTDEASAISTGCGAILQIGLARLDGRASPPPSTDLVEPGPARPPPRVDPPVARVGSDNDQDGIPNDKDHCPDAPEDKDGFEDEDGCPEDDNDRDGVSDRMDRCPNVPETVNGFQDEDGCPDEKVASLLAPADKIDLGEGVLLKGSAFLFTDGKIEFDSADASLNNRAIKLLSRVANYLLGRGKPARVRIAVHSDSMGGTDHNRKLTQARADAIKAQLVKAGVVGSRIVAIGEGEEKPIASNDKPAGRAQNRRVEITLE